MLRAYHRAIIMIFIAPLFSSCAKRVRTPYARPMVPSPPAWSDSLNGKTTGSDWWRVLGDSQVEKLIAQALDQNTDLAAASIRVQRATLEARIAQIPLRPRPTASTSASYTAFSRDKGTNRNISLSLGGDYEPDVFGRLHAQRDSARLDAYAIAEDWQATRQNIVATALQLYWQLAHANQRIELAAQSIAYSERTLDLIRLQYRAGAVSLLELRDSEQSLEAQLAALQQLHRARSVARNTLTLLVGGDVLRIDEPQHLPETAPPTVDLGSPASLVGRRPDLRAAEYRLRAVLAGTDATKASFYPSLTLNSVLTIATSALRENPLATVGTMSLPFVDAQRRHLTIASARANFDEAAARFRQLNLQAFREVADAVEANRTLANSQTSLIRARDAAVEAERLYEIRYRAGAVPLRLWLDAQERRRTAETLVVDNRLAILSNRILLDVSLGGPTI